MKWFYNMKIATKLISSFILVAMIAGIVGVVGIINIKNIDKNDTILYKDMTVPISQVSEIATAFQQVRVATRDIILANSPVEINQQEEIIKNERGVMDKHSSEFEKLILSDEVKNAFNTFKDTRKNYVQYLETLIQLAKGNKDAEAFALLNGEMAKAAKAEQDAIEKLIELKVNGAKDRADDNTATANKATILMIVFVACGMILAIALGVFIARIISKPIKEMVESTERIANGDLDIEFNVNSKDEIGMLSSSFSKMIANLNDVMANINSASEQVASGAKQVSDSSMALSQGATEQASSVEQLTASLEEISAQTRQNADSANEANELAESAKGNAMQGNSQMKDMLKAMDEINDSSSNISKIIKVIDEIAFQTNILALNAAVEAARAGQHGKGFAVVAEEVRNLAARSANAAKETTDMIESSIKKVEGGTRIANETAKALNDIVEGVAKVANLVSDIAVASNEQASGIAQVNQGIMQVSEVVQTNSATSEESAAASEELASQAELLKEQVARFKLKRNHRSGSYVGMESMNPEVLRMLDNMKDKRISKYSSEEDAYGEAAVASTKKIALSDREFGKY